MVWPQDIQQQPVSARSASQNPQLATVGREFYVYTAAIDNGFSLAPAVRQFQVDPSCTFWISNISVIAFQPTVEQAVAPQGVLTLTDNQTNYNIIDSLPLAMITDRNVAYYRTILPRPYGIGALGTMSLTVIFGTLVGSPLSVHQQITLEGWKDFNFSNPVNPGSGG